MRIEKWAVKSKNDRRAITGMRSWSMHCWANLMVKVIEWFVELVIDENDVVKIVVESVFVVLANQHIFSIKMVQKSIRRPSMCPHWPSFLWQRQMKVCSTSSSWWWSVLKKTRGVMVHAYVTGFAFEVAACTLHNTFYLRHLSFSACHTQSSMQQSDTFKLIM